MFTYSSGFSGAWTWTCTHRWSSLLGGGSGSGSSQSAAGQEQIQGLYMYGGVGVGKTMLMDLLVSSAPPEFKVWGAC